MCGAWGAVVGEKLRRHTGCTSGSPSGLPPLPCIPAANPLFRDVAWFSRTLFSSWSTVWGIILALLLEGTSWLPAPVCPPVRASLPAS